MSLCILTRITTQGMHVCVARVESPWSYETVKTHTHNRCCCCLLLFVVVVVCCCCCYCWNVHVHTYPFGICNHEVFPTTVVNKILHVRFPRRPQKCLTRVITMSTRIYIQQCRNTRPPHLGRSSRGQPSWSWQSMTLTSEEVLEFDVTKSFCISLLRTTSKKKLSSGSSYTSSSPPTPKAH